MGKEKDPDIEDIEYMIEIIQKHLKERGSNWLQWIHNCAGNIQVCVHQLQERGYGKKKG